MVGVRGVWMKRSLITSPGHVLPAGEHGKKPGRKATFLRGCRIWKKW